MPGAAAPIVGSVLGAGASIAAGNQAAGAAQSAANAANRTQLQMFNTANALNAPWRQAGVSALNQYAGFLGLQAPPVAPGAAPSTPVAGQVRVPEFGGRAGGLGQFLEQNAVQRNAAVAPMASSTDAGFNPTPQGDAFQNYLNSTGYQFALGQGQQQLDRNAARSGNLLSGRNLMAAQEYGTQFAQREGVQPYLNQLANLAGLGQQTANQSGVNAMNTGSGIASNQLAAGGARQSAYLNTGNALQNLIGQYQYSRGQGSLGNQTPTTGTFGPQNGGWGNIDWGNQLPYGSLPSDRRLKRDIEAIGSHKGLTVYSFRYLDGDTRHVGFMADEVEKVAPEAVSVGADGFKRVDYTRLH